VKLNLDPNLATSVFHVHEFFAYSFTIIGAIVADSWWGQFKTIIVMQVIYFVGAVTTSVGNIEPLGVSIM
jgi:proton-dependent oligopeptide transporter, POT family